MTVIPTEVVKQYWGEIWSPIFEIAFIMCCSSIFTTDMTVVSNLFIVFGELTMANTALSRPVKLFPLLRSKDHLLWFVNSLVDALDVLLQHVYKKLCYVLVLRTRSVSHWVLRIYLIVKALNVVAEA